LPSSPQAPSLGRKNAFRRPSQQTLTGPPSRITRRSAECGTIVQTPAAGLLGPVPIGEDPTNGSSLSWRNFDRAGRPFCYFLWCSYVCLPADGSGSNCRNLGAKLPWGSALGNMIPKRLLLVFAPHRGHCGACLGAFGNGLLWRPPATRAWLALRPIENSRGRSTDHMTENERAKWALVGKGLWHMQFPSNERSV